MTREEREEAIKWFENRKKMRLDDQCQRAEDTALEALRAEPCDEQSVYERAYTAGYDKGYGDGEFFATHKATEPCGDCNVQMDFPNTFDDFAQEYKIVDRKEVYTNGSELIPIFRVKQWLEHTKTQPCEDCVSREAVIKKANSHAEEMSEPFKSNFAVLVEWLLDKLPSVTPERPKRKWIAIQHFEHPEGRDDEDTYYYNQCPNCKKVYENWDFNFCPNCGEYCSGEGDKK